MNIIEAIKSGKPFKRETWSGWAVNRDNNYIVWSENLCQVSFYPEDLLAVDWEVKESYYPITECELMGLRGYSELIRKVPARGEVKI